MVPYVRLRCKKREQTVFGHGGKRMKITVLTENQAGKRGTVAEHGLSVFLELKEKKILLDTGQSDVYVKNAELLGVDLAEADAIVLSHGHYDHCGGLIYFPGKLPDVYVQEGAFDEKYSGNGKTGGWRNIGIPWKRTQNGFYRNGKLEEACFRQTCEIEEIFPDIYVLGGITKWEQWEGVADRFAVLENGVFRKDRMTDEQMLIVREDGRIHVFAGCCHAGIMTCLNRVREAFPGEKIGMIFAGMHLKGCTQERICKTIDALKKMEFDVLVPVHCTGMMAIAQMKMAFGEKCQLVETGKTIQSGRGV